MLKYKIPQIVTLTPYLFIIQLVQRRDRIMNLSLKNPYESTF